MLTRDIAAACELHPSGDRSKEYSTVVLPRGKALCLRNETELCGALTRAALTEWAA